MALFGSALDGYEINHICVCLETKKTSGSILVNSMYLDYTEWSHEISLKIYLNNGYTTKIKIFM
jgi:hypothetical protein